MHMGRVQFRVVLFVHVLLFVHVVLLDLVIYKQNLLLGGLKMEFLIQSMPNLCLCLNQWFRLRNSVTMQLCSLCCCIASYVRVFVQTCILIELYTCVYIILYSCVYYINIYIYICVYGIWISMYIKRERERA